MKSFHKRKILKCNSWNDEKYQPLKIHAPSIFRIQRSLCLNFECTMLIWKIFLDVFSIDVCICVFNLQKFIFSPIFCHFVCRSLQSFICTASIYSIFNWKLVSIRRGFIHRRYSESNSQLSICESHFTHSTSYFSRCSIDNSEKCAEHICRLLSEHYRGR